jgi:ChrR Cupin-like domain
MPKPEREFFPVTDVEWTPAQGGLVPGLHERILVSDPSSGVATRILRFDPGTDTSAAGPQVHAFWEEVYILEGSLHDLSLNQTFPKGTYACRPPGMRHGPWVAPEGCVTFEVRYAV